MKTSIGLDKELMKGDAHIAEEGITHDINHEFMKKGKTSIGLEKGWKVEEARHLDGSIAHEMKDEVLKSSKDLSGLGKAYDEHLKIAKELHKGEVIADGSTAYEKAIEQAHKNAHAHMGEEELRKYMEEAFAEKGKVYGAESTFGKDLIAHDMNRKIASGNGKSYHTSVGDEIFKSKEAHGFDQSFSTEKEKAVFGSKIPQESAIKHGIAHDSVFSPGADKAFKIHEDEFLLKDKGYGADSQFFKDKEILESTGKHHVMKDESAHVLHGSAFDKHHTEIASEKGHKDLKTKLLELLKRVLHIGKCHLVTMRPGELLSIVRCVSNSKDPRLCEKFAMCEKKMPIRVIEALEKCQKETIPEGVKKCTKEAPLYSSPEIPLKIFQCVAINVRELIPQEKKEMIDFEECARFLKAESCGRVSWFRGRH